MGCRKLQLPDSFQLVNCHHEAHEVPEDDFFQNHSMKYRAARFIVYSGFKQIASFLIQNSSLIIEHSYLWQPIGQDVPLWTIDYTVNDGNLPVGATRYYYIADGNKNIRAMVDPTGNTVAEYDYNPFGKLVIHNSSFVIDPNPFRFSSEYHDDETGLVCYNYRYYDPKLGRWLSRDPIGEQGGYNLYGMVGNNGVNRWDYIGLSSQSWGIVNWKQRLQQIIRASYHGNKPNFDEVFQRLMKDQLRVDPDDDLYGDCQDDMEDIFTALYDEIALAHHGSSVQELFPKLRDDGSNLAHFLGGAAYEMSMGIINLGEIAQWSYEANDGFKGDWQRDTAVAYLGAYFADKFDTSDCECKKMVKAFADGTIKFTDLFMNNPRKMLPDEVSTDFRNEFIKRAKDHIDKILRLNKKQGNNI